MTQTDRVAGLVGNTAIKAPCRTATTAAITLSGLQTIDGVVLVADDRVLVKNQADNTENGIYVADTGDWERAKDCDGVYDLLTGTFVYITGGSTTVGFWYCTTANPITVGTSALVFAQASSVLAAVSAFMQTVLDDANAAAAAATLAVLPLAGGTLTGDATIAKATPSLFLNATGSTNPGVRFQKDGVTRWRFADREADTLDFSLFNAADAIEVIRFSQSTGAAAFAGLVDLSASTAGQIKFPATQNASSDANTLDDYEEGDWTPAVTPAGSITYTSRVGRYSKVGNKVYVAFQIVVNAIGTGGTSGVQGLPFTSANVAGINPTLAVGELITSATNVVFATCLIVANDVQFTVKSLTVAAASLGTNAIFGNGTTLNASGTYTV